MSQFVVSARKYRPKTFDEVVGQSHVASTLKNALQKDQLAHAYLFTGPHGVGKTTCARLLAKVLNCQNITEGQNPCNTCSSCEAFSNSASFNIIELDAASNNSVEHMRSLIEQVRFQPQEGKYKIFIIDEVHMLSTSAFNAFLKTLEEPPSYAIFILATTEKHKIIPTILSRCQIYDFKRIQNNDIIEQLSNIAEKENLKYEPEALNIIAEKADGAMRDALSIFDRIVSSSNGTIEYKSVLENLNILDYEYYFKMIDSAIQEDLASVILHFHEVLNNGFEPAIFLKGMLEHLRKLLLAKNEKTLSLLTVGPELKERYVNQAMLTSSSFVLTSLNLINNAEIALQRASNKIITSEIALSKMTFFNRIEDLSKKKRTALN